MGTLQELARRYWWIALCIVGLILWFRDHDNMIRNSARIQASVDSIAIVAANLKETVTIMHKADSIARIQISSLQDEIRDRTRERDVAKGLVKAYQSRLDVALPDSLKPIFDSLMHENQTVINNYEEQIRAMGDIIAIKDSQLVQKDSIITRQQEAIDTLNKKFASYVKSQTRGTALSKAVNVGTKVLAAYGAVKLIESLASN